MSFVQTDRLLSSTSFRLSAIYAGLLLASFVLASVGAWWATRTAAIDAVRDGIQAESVLLSGIAEDRGPQAAAEAIRARLSHPTTLIYRLDDGRGALVAGDPTIPNDVVSWRFVDLVDNPSPKGRGDHIVFTKVLADGARLSVGDDLERSEHIRDAVLRTLVWVGVASVLLALAAGLWATQRALARMGALSHTVRQVGAGDLSVRAPTRSGDAPDDIDQLTAGFNDMLDRIDRLVANIRRVSANVAHDLRTPLTHVRQKLETAQQAPSAEGRNAALEAAQTDIDEVLRTFDAMLRLAEIDSGAMRARFAPVSLSAVVERVADAYRPDVESSGRWLEVNAEDGVTVLGDSHLLAQALSNLLDNSMRHAQRGTTIDLYLESVDDRARLVVRDNGPGIPSDQYERVIEPFERGDESRGSPGSGLGLSIVDAVSRLHGATMVLDDARPGLRVVIEFPATGS